MSESEIEIRKLVLNQLKEVVKSNTIPSDKEINRRFKINHKSSLLRNQIINAIAKLKSTNTQKIDWRTNQKFKEIVKKITNKYIANGINPNNYVATSIQSHKEEVKDIIPENLQNKLEYPPYNNKSLPLNEEQINERVNTTTNIKLLYNSLKNEIRKIIEIRIKKNQTNTSKEHHITDENIKIIEKIYNRIKYIERKRDFYEYNIEKLQDPNNIIYMEFAENIINKKNNIYALQYNDIIKFNNTNEGSIRKLITDGFHIKYKKNYTQHKKNEKELVSLKVGTFNILSDGLCLGEFLSEGGNSKSAGWNMREPKIHKILDEMFENLDIVVTQENDHFFSILQHLKEKNKKIEGVFLIKSDKKGNVINPSNSRSIAIGRLYKYYAEQINTNVKPKNNKYSEKYEILNGKKTLNFPKSIKFPPEYTYKTFQEESSNFCQISSAIYNKEETDIYCQDDGIGIYYDSSKVTLKKIYTDKIDIDFNEKYELTEDIFKTKLRTEEDGYLLTNKDGYLMCKFIINNNPEIEFNLCGAHLQSGEDKKGELERVSVLKKIMKILSTEKLPIICMDSNTSLLNEKDIKLGSFDLDEKDYKKLKEYITSSNMKEKVDADGKKKYEVTLNNHVSELISDNELIKMRDVGKSQPYFECFKMRHAMGDQPKKFCNFVFDTIDKIVVQKDIKAELLPKLESFKYYDETKYKILYSIRTNPDIKEAFKKLCEMTGKTKNDKSLITNGKNGEKKNAQNSTIAFNRRNNKPYRTAKEELLKKIMKGIESMDFIKQLYPNNGAPSDHPPLCAEIFLPIS